VKYLLDTNVVSELRKGARADANVVAWFGKAAAEDLFLSVIIVGEIRRGIELIRRRDTAAAHALDRWMARLQAGFEERILPVDGPIAEEWGRMNVPNPLPAVDSLLAATAKVHGLVLATRNVKDVASTGVRTLNPFVA
jgi:predicted nucleic acid-binding protein